MLVQKFPKASQEKHLLRGFSFPVAGIADPLGSWAGSGLDRHYNLTICTFGGCPAARLVLETRIQEYGSGLR